MVCHSSSWVTCPIIRYWHDIFSSSWGTSPIPRCDLDVMVSWDPTNKAQSDMIDLNIYLSCKWLNAKCR